ncbi:allophanate hydrolase [Xenophilus arseniciresistens]|uniref:Allophanate hydrolase n=1 Tax=Xenophilus arseniciresistens TaxID=1283306 RepID=A0AAE3NC98_9BURK|nr:allophanate hydrolase [Xenophilus arseniciresistens]MDA7419026.1 allophanate hydrolase [Xenophilus arseniciresistens]
MVHALSAVAQPRPELDGLPAAAWITRLDAPLPPLAAAPGAPGDALAGLRFAVKDNIDVGGLPTTAGCPAFAYVAPEDATVVQRLRAAGAALQGKTNLDQFACGLNGTRSPYGAVPNSFDAKLVSGGSSSGSAYVVATGEVDFALGTDTAGSGRVPAGLNNIVGIKPSRGLISARGLVPAAQSVDCVSIFARTVALAARVLHEAMGPDPADPYSRSLAMAPAHWPARFRFGVPSLREFFGDAQAQAAWDEAIARLQGLGGTPVQIDYAPLAEAAALLYESALVAERHAAVGAFFDAHEAQVMEPVRGILAQGRRHSASEHAQALTRLRMLGQRAAAMWAQIDVLAVPTAPTHCSIADMRADPVGRNSRMGVYTNFVNLLDYAAIAVPSSLRPDGLPFGITFVGQAGSDFALAALGQRYHHASGLPLGATGQPLPATEALPQPPADGDCVQVAVVGAHLSGMPLNSQLLERGGRLLRSTRTTADYRLHALPGTTPPKPGLVRVAAGEGAAIEVEVWSLPVGRYGSFVALIPAPLGIGTLSLADGSAVQGFLCEASALAGAQDISHHGGWRAYMAQRTA